MSRGLSALAILGLCLAPLPARPLQSRDAAKDSLRAYVLHKQARQAYGVYVGNNKVGWAIDELRLGKYAGKEVAVQVSEGYVALTTDGEKSILETKTLTYFSLEGEGEIVGIEERTREDKTQTRRTAVRDKDPLLITTWSGQRKTERRVPLPRETLGLSRKFERWLAANPAKGATFISYTTSLDQADISTKEVYTFQEKKSILWGGVPTEVCLVRHNSQGAIFDTEMKTDGTVLKGKLGGLFDIRAEKEAVAKKLDGGNVDLVAASSISVDRRLGRAAYVEALTLEASGLGDFVLPASHRQRVRAGKDGTVIVELTRDRKLAQRVPLAPQEQKKYLEATPSIQAEEPTVRKLAGKIVGKEKDPVKAADLLQRWVYKNLEKSMAANASTALDVLDNKAGDCTEHALLFVTLARAAGVPAREVGGLAYLNGPRPLFGWHAWAEIHDGGQWVTVDPTWGQVYVDATHIKFSEGTEDLSWVNVVGKLKFKVLKVERKR
jgi:hypothetical protein